MLFFFNDTATTEIYTLSLHDALPISARANAFSETENNEKPGGSASAFCAPVSITSMPSASISIFTAENDDTVSTTSATSGYLVRTRQISSSGFMTPVEVSLWVNVTVSNLPVASCLSTVAGSICFPQSTWSGSAFFPQRFATSSHLSENAPHMQQSTPRSARFLIEASITPHAEEVDRNTGCFVPNNVWSPA